MMLYPGAGYPALYFPKVGAIQVWAATVNRVLGSGVTT